MDAPNTLREAVIYFADADRCNAFMTDLRWPDGKVCCPRCGSVRVSYLAKANVWKCYENHPKAKFSLKVGTIFEDSPIGLDKWLVAVWLIVNAKNGVSSYEMARSLGVTQKSAWFMLHRVRLAMQDGDTGGKLGGEVEVDETFIGGKARNMHARKRKAVMSTLRADGQPSKSNRWAGKVAVLGLLERGQSGSSRVRTVPVADVRKHRLQAEVRKNVETGSGVFTDALHSYRGLGDDFTHQVVDHAECYAHGNVHTNGLENFWSLLKRSINGTYVSVEPFHLFRYLDEQAFRFNNRTAMSDYDRFRLAASQVVGKRLTYDELSGKAPDGAAL